MSWHSHLHSSLYNLTRYHIIRKLFSEYIWVHLLALLLFLLINNFIKYIPHQKLLKPLPLHLVTDSMNRTPPHSPMTLSKDTQLSSTQQMPINRHLQENCFCDAAFGHLYACYIFSIGSSTFFEERKLINEHFWGALKSRGPKEGRDKGSQLRNGSLGFVLFL